MYIKKYSKHERESERERYIYREREPPKNITRKS